MSGNSLDVLRWTSNLLLAVVQAATPVVLFSGGFETQAARVGPARPPSPIVPAGYAFAIWGLIYFGALVYAIYQALPSQRAEPALREIGWFTAAAFAACTGWLLAARFGPPLATVPLIMVMLGCLIVALLTVVRWREPLDPRVAFAVILPLAVYAGWLTVAVFANLSEVLPDYGFARFGLSENAWTLLMLALASALALAIQAASRGNLAYSAAVSWALVAIVAANAQRGPNVPVIVAAALAAMMVAAGAVVARLPGRCC